MTGTEKIINHIRADAQGQVDAILADAKEKCAAIAADYAARAEEAYNEKIRRGVKACSDMSESRERLSQMEIKKDILSLKQEMVSRSFDRAGEMILSLDHGAYLAFLKKLAANSAVGGEEIILNAKDRAEYGEELVSAVNKELDNAEPLSLSAEVGDFTGGLVLRRGNVDVNCTVGLLLDLCRGEMSSQIAEKLFDK